MSTVNTMLADVKKLAYSLGLSTDRPADYWVNIRYPDNKQILYTAASTKEAWAWLQGYKHARMLAGCRDNRVMDGNAPES